MKIICVAGQVCAGKTTTTDIIARQLPNSAIVRGDNFLKSAFINHKDDFEEIYNVPFDIDRPYESFEQIRYDISAESVNKYRQYCNAFRPYIEQEILKEVDENRKQAKDFVVIDYIALSVFEIWKLADYRIMIVSNNELRLPKLYQRTIDKGNEYNEDFVLMREKAVADVIENATGIDLLIENKYDGNIEKELLCLYRKIMNSN